MVARGLYTQCHAHTHMHTPTHTHMNSHALHSISNNYEDVNIGQ